MSGSAVKILSTIVSVGGPFGKDQMSDTIQSQKLQNVWFATPMYLKSQWKEGRKHLRICSHGIELHVVLKKIAMNTDQTLKKISTRKRERDHHLAADLALKDV
jgi:hypothetical protein